MKKFPLFKRVRSSLLLLVAILFMSLNASSQLDFTPNPTGACTPATVEFAINSDPATYTGTFDWDFGNTNYRNNVLVNDAVSANYGPPGVYTIELEYTPTGETVSKQIEIYPNPNPVLGEPLTGCELFSGDLTVQLEPVVVNDTTYVSGPFSSFVGGITGGFADSVTWDFLGDLPTVGQKLTPGSTSATLSLTDIPAGSYDLFFKVIDEYGCEKTVFQPNAIIVNTNSSADFSFLKENSCGLGNVEFTGITDADPSGALYEWTIEGSTVSNNLSFTHNFSVAGDYSVTFKVTNSNGCTTSVTKTINFNSNNNANYSFIGTCVNAPTNFTDSSGDLSNIVLREWDFNDDGIFENTSQNPSQIFTSLGNKSVTLRVTFNDGCVLNSTQNVEIKGATATFDYDATSACAPTYSVNFSSTSVASAGSSITGWSWDFNNDGISDSDLENPTFNFGNSGTFPVKLSVTTSDNCTNSISTNVVLVEPIISIAATPDMGCAPLSTNFLVTYNKMEVLHLTGR